MYRTQYTPSPYFAINYVCTVHSVDPPPTLLLTMYRTVLVCGHSVDPPPTLLWIWWQNCRDIVGKICFISQLKSAITPDLYIVINIYSLFTINLSHTIQVQGTTTTPTVFIHIFAGKLFIIDSSKNITHFSFRSLRVWSEFGNKNVTGVIENNRFFHHVHSGLKYFLR